MSIDFMKNDKNFDLAKFNKTFEEQSIALREKKNQEEMEKLRLMNTEEYYKKISEKTLSEIMKEWKDALLGVINDAIRLNINRDTLLTENRLFYVGITVLFIVVTLYIFSTFFWKSNPKPEKITNEYIIKLVGK
jgi:hypothetical protein